MSTDYVLCCECGEMWSTNNIDEYDANKILIDLSALAKLYEVMQQIRTDVYLSTHFSSSNELDGLLKFAFEHHQHRINVINEYLYFEIISKEIEPLPGD